MIATAELSAPTTTAAPLPAGKTRHGATDVFRMSAVIPIVFYHAGVLAQLPALLGMHAMIAAAVFFAAKSRSRSSAGRIVARRAVRLLIPWLFYDLLHLFSVIKNGKFEPWMLMAGTSLHLWFVPFIFIATCAVAVIARRGELPKGWLYFAVFAAAALLMIHVEASHSGGLLRYTPAWQFWDGATAVLVTLAALSVPGGAWTRIVATLGLSLASVAVWTPFRTAPQMYVPPAGFGTLLFLLVAMLPAGSNRLTDFLGRASFGVYLMHIFVAAVIIKAVARHQHLANVEALPASTVAICCVVTVLICLTLLFVLERTPARRILM